MISVVVLSLLSLGGAFYCWSLLGWTYDIKRQLKIVYLLVLGCAVTVVVISIVAGEELKWSPEEPSLFIEIPAVISVSYFLYGVSDIVHMVFNFGRKPWVPSSQLCHSTNNLVVLSASQCSTSEGVLESNMKKKEPYRVIQSEALSELKKFAAWFHQDWKLIFPDFQEGSKMYLEGIADHQKIKLVRELKEFVDTNKNSSQEEVKKAWLDLGAHGWQSNLDILLTLQNFAEVNSNNSP